MAVENPKAQISLFMLPSIFVLGPSLTYPAEAVESQADYETVNAIREPVKVRPCQFFAFCAYADLLSSSWPFLSCLQ